ncbi:tyrosine-type recombinase/integrase [Tropicimonas sp. TH_r6]|uniref:tyrosine-type recombinase/integrase n=1 Tax=Tropicimonas sp. TH_r6 TaxID=3082085 RepID=UPI002955225C|nr:tyrosine-type recombinase/integrase [Tropicimonas sp. TH_r6]MDV7145934.1 tyrosine-type recombinase/integrase [Tropicimonas sp. TH_r6]
MVLHVAQIPGGTSDATILKEMVRYQISRISDDAANPEIDIDVRIENLELENERMAKDMRNRIYATAAPYVLAAASRLGVTCEVPLSSTFGRTAASTLRTLLGIERDAFDLGEDPIIAASALFSRFGISPVDGRVPPLVRISDVIEAAVEGQTAEMRRKLRCTGNIAIELLGDIPLELLTEQATGLLLDLSRLPKLHGKKHGKNRHRSEGVTLTKREEIALADACDARTFDTISALSDLSLAQKRARVSEELVPRIAHTNLERHLDRLHQLLRCAKAKCGYTGPVKLMTYTDLARLMKAANEDLRAANELFARATKPKIRLRWAGERIKTLLTSPIYRGSFSRSRRTRTGRMIFRDALYWVPLILLTMGTRVTEVLQLKTRDLLRRDHVFCMRLCWSAEQDGKTRESTRIVPIPQLLIDLGFVEWIKSLADDPDTLLFPEIMKVKPDQPADILSKRFLTVRENLDIKDYNEDFYALRKTLSSALWRGGVSREDRQMIIGHASDTTIGKHYTDADMASLKELLDQADHRIEVTTATRHRHPVIKDCTLVARRLASAEVVLDESGNLGAVRIKDDVSGRSILALDIRGSDMPAVPRWRGIETVTRRTGAEAAADLVSEFHIKTPSRREHRDAWEHFLALASYCSEATHFRNQA